MADVVRYYLPSSGAAAHNPAWSGAWTAHEAFQYAAVTSKSSSAHAARVAPNYPADTQQTVGAIQYVTAAVAADHEWTTADAIELQGLCDKSDNCTTAYLYLIVRVFNADCSSVVGTLFAGAGPTSCNAAWPGQNRALVAGGGHVHVQNAVSMSAGDHVVIEIGFDEISTVAWNGCSFEAGDDQASDYPVNETDAGQDHDPWIEFTMEEAGGDAGVYAGSLDLAALPSAPIADLWHSSLLKWCNEGKSSIGDVYLRAQSQPSFYLGLYANSDGEPAVGAIVDDLDEPSGANGYARIALADNEWTETSQGTFTNLQKTFTCATADWGDVYGWFICTAASGVDCDLITVEQFTNAPHHIHVGDTEKVTPKLTFT